MSDRDVIFDVTQPPHDSGGAAYCNFRLEDVAGQEVYFEVGNPTENRWGDYGSFHASYTTDRYGDDFKRFGEPQGGGWTHTFGNDENVVYVGFFVYGYDRSVAFVNSASNSDYVTQTYIGDSFSGRPMYALEIEDSNVSGSKQDIVITSRQHPGEVYPSFQVEEMVEYTTGLFEEDGFDSDYRFFVIPHGNPDGMVNGWQRSNQNGNNLNREWEDADPDQEVDNMKTYLSNAVENMYWGLDMHTHPNTARILHDDTNLTGEELDTVMDLENALKENTHSDPEVTEGWAQNYFSSELGGAGVTVEINDWREYTVTELQEEGRGLIDVLTETV